MSPLPTDDACAEAGENANAGTDAQCGLRSCSYETVPPRELRGTFDCKVVRVFDGDTLWVAVSEGERLCRVCCRLLDVDAPEMPASHDLAMEPRGRAAFAARDRLVELLTDVDLAARKREHGGPRFADTSGTELPSLSDADLQRVLDAHNTLVLRGGLSLHDGTDMYGRYLARLRTADGRDASATLVREGLADARHR